MSTAKQFVITDEDLLQEGGASYAALNVPQDYPARLAGVEDYKTDKSEGWALTFDIEGLSFKFWVPHLDRTKWKVIQVVEALDPGFFEVRDSGGLTRPINMDAYIGRSCGAHVDYEDEPEDPSTIRKVIHRVFPLATIEDVLMDPTNTELDTTNPPHGESDSPTEPAQL